MWQGTTLLGCLLVPSFQQFSQCKTPSASQAELAAVASTLKLFGNTLARHRVGLTIHADCLFAIQATKGLCASKACSVLTDLTRKDFVLLSQYIPIDTIHVSAHQGDIGNEFADLLANMPARVLHLIPLPSGRTGAWISICLFVMIWLRRNFGLLLSKLMIPCAPGFSFRFVSKAKSLIWMVIKNPDVG